MGKEAAVRSGMLRAVSKLIVITNKTDANISEIEKRFDIFKRKDRPMEKHVEGVIHKTTFPNPPSYFKEDVQIVSNLKDQEFKSFLIIGKTGTGKSSLCNRI